jgi:hypothetical protein
VRARLHAFARSRFERCLARYAAGAEHPVPDDPWHLLEAHLTVSATRGGKRYKDWLFARVAGSGDPPLDVVQGGASLMMRDVVRDYIRRECAPPSAVSLSRPLVEGGERSVTLLDLLPAGLDPACDVCLREYETLAEEHAREFAAELSQRERIVLIAKSLRLSLAHPAVEQLAGCRKSTLSDAYRDLMQRIAERLRARYREDDVESVLTLALMTVEKVSAGIFHAEKSENTLAGLFMLGRETVS